jgi:hypothetical protein
VAGCCRFAAATGWDAATGLGTPHFDKLLAAAMAAGEKISSVKTMQLVKKE